MLIQKGLKEDTIKVSRLKAWYIKKVDPRLNEFFGTGVMELFVNELPVGERLQHYCERLRQVRTIYEYESGVIAEKPWDGVPTGERVKRSSLKLNYPVNWL